MVVTVLLFLKVVHVSRLSVGVVSPSLEVPLIHIVQKALLDTAKKK